MKRGEEGCGGGIAKPDHADVVETQVTFYIFSNKVFDMTTKQKTYKRLISLINNNSK